jgi:AcrR family transcriptional regulator
MRGVVQKEQVAPPATPRRKSAAVPAAKKSKNKAAAKDRLNRTDWIDAGEAILCQSGITGVKLAALTERLGVSIGSFYHHFESFEHYLGDLADNYSVERVRHELDLASGSDLAPLDRIQRLRMVSAQLGTFELDRAMRVWATIDARAEKTLRRAETLVLAFLEQAFRELGFDRTEATLRARILLSVNVVAVGTAESKAHTDYLKKVLRLLAQPPG